MSKYTVTTWDSYSKEDGGNSTQLKTKDEVISHLMLMISEMSETDIEIVYPDTGKLTYDGWGFKE